MKSLRYYQVRLEECAAAADIAAGRAPALPVHREPALSWHNGFREGAMLDVRRRQFITLIGVAAASPLAARDSKWLCP